MRSLEIAVFELKRLLSARPLRLALVVVCLVPLLYGGLWLWAFWNPYDRLDTLPVALVNEDRACTVDGTTVHAGADLEQQLAKSDSFDWEIVSADQAAQGLEAGSYYMTLTVPKDFSSRLAHADRDTAKAGVLRVAANESTNLLASQIGSRVFLEIQSALNQSTTQTYLDHIFLGIGTARVGLSRAGGGAAKLTAALRQARSGSSKLANGLGTAKRGAAALNSGLGTLAGGAGKLKSGAASAATGASRLATGIKAADAGASDLAAGSRSLSGGATSLSSGLQSLSGHGGDLAAGAAQLGTSASQVSDGAAALAAKTDDATAATAQLAAGASQLRELLAAYAAANPDAEGDGEFEAAMQAAEQVSAGLSQLSSGLTSVKPAAKQLASGASAVAGGANKLSTSIGDYVDGVQDAAKGAKQLDAGVADLSSGASSLASGLGKASGGASALATGAKSLTAGSAALAAGTSKATAGATSLAGGLGTLEAGSAKLTAGLGKVARGSAALSTSLSDGASSLPKLTRTARETRTKMMSAPVVLSTERDHAVSNYGTGFAPYFIPLALWIGALMTYFLVRPLGGRALASTLSDPFVVLSGLWPAVAITWLQAGVLLIVVELGLHLDSVLPLAFVALTLVAAFAFTAIMQFLSAAFGTAGKFLAVVLLMLQLTSAAGTFPIETAPRFFQVLNPLLPMTYVVKGMRQAISGGSLGHVAVNALVLLGYAGVAIGLTLLVTRRQRTWTMSRLKPVLGL